MHNVGERPKKTNLQYSGTFLYYSTDIQSNNIALIVF